MTKEMKVIGPLWAKINYMVLEVLGEGGKRGPKAYFIQKTHLQVA